MRIDIGIGFSLDGIVPAVMRHGIRRMGKSIAAEEGDLVANILGI